MMMNIFSMFDPTSSKFIISNWLSIFSCLLFIPFLFFFKNSRNTYMIMLFNNFYTVSIKNNLSKLNIKIMIILIMIAFYMTSLNLLSLMPFYFTPTAHISVTMSMSLTLWLGLTMKNWMTETNNMFSHLVPNSTPALLCPLMVIIETISNSIRPMTLSIRLSANMIAGHILISLLSKTISTSILMCVSTLLVLNILTVLEISVSFIQSYIFITLLSLYLNEM